MEKIKNALINLGQVEEELKSLTLSEVLSAGISAEQQQNILEALALLTRTMDALHIVEASTNHPKMIVFFRTHTKEKIMPRLTRAMLDLMACGNKIKAVNLYREKHGFALADAKAACEQGYRTSDVYIHGGGYEYDITHEVNPGVAAKLL